MSRPALGLSFALFVACQSATAPPARDPLKPTSSPTWCQAVDGALAGPETRGFHCLSIPNFLVTGFFGPAHNPERSDFVNACFGGDDKAATRLRMSVRPAADLGFHYSAERELDASGGLDLGFLGPWAPKLRGEQASKTELAIDVAFEDAEMRVLSSVGEILGQELGQVPEGSPLAQSLETCVASVCGEGADHDVYTAKVLAAVPVIRVKTTGDSHTRVDLAEGIASFAVDREQSQGSLLVLRGKEKLNVAALVEPAASAFEASKTCSRLRAIRTRRDVVAGLREIGLRTLGSRSLAEVPELARPLRKAIEQTDGAFSANEQTAILEAIEAVEGAARQLALDAPTGSLCAARSLAQTVLTQSGEDNRVHAVLTDVLQPLFEKLTDLANSHTLPCAEPQWYLDQDRDGFGDRQKSTRSSTQPPGYVANALDCYDGNPEAHPGQMRYFPQHRGDGSFDYDCDGRANKREEVVSGGCREITILGYPTRCWADAGWQGSVPDCGQQGKWLAECEVSTLRCTAARETRDVQECR